MTSALDWQISRIYYEMLPLHTDSEEWKALRKKVKSLEAELLEETEVTKELEEKLAVKRSWVSGAIDRIRGITLGSIWGLWKGIAAAAAVSGLIYFAVSYDANRRKVIDSSESSRDMPGVEFSMPSLQNSYILKASASAGVDINVLESLVYAANANPAYVASARASGRRGIIPLDPAAVGVKGELLDADPELCITVAAEHYAHLRKMSGSDLEAVAGVVAGWDECQAAVAKAKENLVEVNSRRMSGYDPLEVELEAHYHTLEMIEKHKKGELTGLDCYIALTMGSQGGGIYYNGFDARYKKEFEEAISSPPHNPEKFLVNPKYSPKIKILRPEYLEEAKRSVYAYRDFTIHIPESARAAVNSARAFLNSRK